MKCKKCGGNVIDIIEKQLSVITPIGQNERLHMSNHSTVIGRTV